MIKLIMRHIHSSEGGNPRDAGVRHACRITIFFKLP